MTRFKKARDISPWPLHCPLHLPRAIICSNLSFLYFYRWFCAQCWLTRRSSCFVPDVVRKAKFHSIHYVVTYKLLCKPWQLNNQLEMYVIYVYKKQTKYDAIVYIYTCRTRTYVALEWATETFTRPLASCYELNMIMSVRIMLYRGSNLI